MKTSKRLIAVFVSLVMVWMLAPASLPAYAREDETATEELPITDDDGSDDPNPDDPNPDNPNPDDPNPDNPNPDNPNPDDPDPETEPEPGVVELEPVDDANTNANNIQAALRQAREYVGEGQFRVVLKSGVYEINRGISIFSNTELVLEDGAVIKRAADNNGNSLFNIGYEDSGSTAYDTAHDVTITGGTWDNAGHSSGKVLHFEQCTGVVIRDAVFQHSRTDHVIMFDGVKDARVSGCTFSDCISDSSLHAKLRYVNETIHIDSTRGDAPNDNVGHANGLPSRDITIDGCTFDGVCCAAGAHYHGEGDPVQYNITVTNNIVKKVESGSTAFTAANTSGWVLKNNTFTGTGTECFARLNGCKSYSISGNTVNNVRSFVEDNGAANKLKSSGTLSGNTVTNIRKTAFRCSGIASTHTFSGENYVTTNKDVPNNSADHCFIYVDTATVTMKNCTLKYDDGLKFNTTSDWVTTIKFMKGKFTIQNNKIYNAPFAGLNLDYATSGSSVTGNTIGWCGRVKSGTNSISLVVGHSSGVTVTDNTIKECYHGGIYLDGSSKNTVKNNVITVKASSEFGDVVQYNGSTNNGLSNNGPLQVASKMPVKSTSTNLVAGTLKSSNTSVVSVSGKTITAKKTGTATITMTYNGRTYTKSVSVISIHGKKYEMESAVKSTYVLDIQKGSTSNGAQMIVYQRNGGKNQQYQFYLQSDGTYAIRSVKSQKWLNVKGSSKDNSAPVVQWSWTGGKNMKWKITVDNKNRVTFVNYNSGKCFDVQGGKTQNGSKIIQYTSNNGNNQKWWLKEK